MDKRLVSMMFVVVAAMLCDAKISDKACLDNIERYFETHQIPTGCHKYNTHELRDNLLRSVECFENFVQIGEAASLHKGHDSGHPFTQQVISEYYRCKSGLYIGPQGTIMQAPPRAHQPQIYAPHPQAHPGQQAFYPPPSYQQPPPPQPYQYPQPMQAPPQYQAPQPMPHGGYLPPAGVTPNAPYGNMPPPSSGKTSNPSTEKGLFSGILSFKEKSKPNPPNAYLPLPAPVSTPSYTPNAPSGYLPAPTSTKKPDSSSGKSMLAKVFSSSENKKSSSIKKPPTPSGPTPGFTSAPTPGFTSGPTPGFTSGKMPALPPVNNPNAHSGYLLPAPSQQMLALPPVNQTPVPSIQAPPAKKSVLSSLFSKGDKKKSGQLLLEAP